MLHTHTHMEKKKRHWKTAQERTKPPVETLTTREPYTGGLRISLDVTYILLLVNYGIPTFTGAALEKSPTSGQEGGTTRVAGESVPSLGKQS